MAEIGPYKAVGLGRYRHLLAPAYVGRVPLGQDVDLTREIRGVVVEVMDDDSEVPIANAVVKLFYRQSDAIVERTMTEADGSFVFSGLIFGTGKYYAVAFYPGTGGTFPNARIYDRLTAQEP